MFIFKFNYFGYIDLQRKIHLKNYMSSSIKNTYSHAAWLKQLWQFKKNKLTFRHLNLKYVIKFKKMVMSF